MTLTANHFIVLLAVFGTMSVTAGPIRGSDDPETTETAVSDDTRTEADQTEAASQAEPTGSKDPQPRYVLRYQFTPGEKLRYESTSEKTQEGIAPFGRKVDTTRLNQRRVFTVSEVTDKGQAKVSMQFEHVRMEMKTGDKPWEVFDSTMEPSAVPQRFQAAAHNLKGAAPTYTVYTAGNPVTADGVQEVPDGGHATFMMPLPEQAIAVGDTWKVNLKVTARLDKNLKRDIILLRSYRLSKVDGDVATIGFSTSIISTVKNPKVKAQLLEATPQGEMTFDIRNGRLLKKEMRVDKLVMGALGPNTMLQAKGTTVEKLIAEDASVTAR